MNTRKGLNRRVQRLLPERELLCRFLDAGDEGAFHREAAGVQKAPRHEVAGSLALAGGEYYGDLISAPAMMVDASVREATWMGVEGRPGLSVGLPREFLSPVWTIL